MEVELHIPFQGRQYQPNEVQLFLFSASTWNAHRIHYDRDYAISEGHKDLLVHGHLQGSWLAEAVLGWAGTNGLIRKLTYRNVDAGYVNETFTTAGTILAIESKESSQAILSGSVQVSRGASITADGTFIVECPRKHLGERLGVT